MSKLVTVYDDLEPLNNVISALSLGVDELVFVYHHEAQRNNFANIRKVIKKYLRNAKISFINTKDDEKEIGDLLRDKDTIVDVGGAKYLSLLLFELAKKNGNRILYFDDEEGVIKDYHGHSISIRNVFKLSIEDILTLRGGEIKEYMHQPQTDRKTREAIVALVQENIENYPSFVRFIGELGSIVRNDAKSKEKNLAYRLSKDQEKKIKSDPVYRRCSRLFRIEEGELIFADSRLRDMISISGAFLENYLYIKLTDSGFFDEVLMSVVIDFSEDKYEHPVRCEIDCVVLKDNRVLMVSCKSSKAQTEDLNEIFVHNTMFGNALSAPVLFVGEELDRRYPSIYAKAEELQIYIVDRSDMEDDDVVSTFSSIFEGTYRYDVLY